jgi:vacuolar protein sorting-associated protein 26
MHLCFAEVFYSQGNNYEFTSLVQELEPPGEFTTSKIYEFDFDSVDKQFESYHGINVRLR